MKGSYTDIDSYISQFPSDIARQLETLRKIIKKAAPDSKEVISYGMPAFRQKGVLVYFAAFKSHIGFYPTSSPIRVFADELEKYETSKGTIKFPLGSPFPEDLITRIVKYRKEEDIVKAKK